MAAHLGGKVTTYRRLAEHALETLARTLPALADTILSDARSLDDFEHDFGGGLRQREVDYLVARGWPTTSCGGAPRSACTWPEVP